MLRLLGVILFGLGLVVLGADLWRHIGGAEPGFRLSALGEWWFWLHRDSLQLLQPAVERHLSPALWDPGIQTLLEWSAAIELLVLGALLASAGFAMGRRRT
ncbi:MAG: hypothetical protein AAF713_22590 [Pseudomonadota bacterium]